MLWDEYYEKINDWAVSTAVNKISSLEDMGASDEITDAINIIAFEDEKGAERACQRDGSLLNKQYIRVNMAERKPKKTHSRCTLMASSTI